MILSESEAQCLKVTFFRKIFLINSPSDYFLALSLTTYICVLLFGSSYKLFFIFPECHYWCCEVFLSFKNF